MCGDGANDCSALKTSDVGISLSEAESSVASPFTSHQPDISCVPKIIKEGRTALVTAFGLFKFMVLYSMVEFFSTGLLITRRTELSDMEFLFIDGALSVLVAFFFGQTKPHHGPLVSNPPSSHILSALPLISMSLQYALMISLQILSDILIQTYPWYQEISRKSTKTLYQYDNYAVYTISQFQYIILAITFSVGYPYREPIYRNVGFFASLILMTCLSAIITVCPPKFLVDMFEFRLPPSYHFRFIIIGLSVITFVVSIMLESVLINIIFARIFSNRGKKKIYDENYSSKNLPSIKTSIEHLSQIEFKCYGTIRS